MNEYLQPFISNLEQLGTNMGWFSNLMGIGIPLITLFLFLRAKISSRSKQKEYSDFSSMIADKLNSSRTDIYKTKTIAIVDDNPEHYPIDYLNRCGYRITPIESISLANVDQLFSFDLLILDITNIVVEDPKRGGLTLLKKVKSERPDMLTIAASSKRYDPTLTEFFKLANDQIKTPIEHGELEQKIVNVLNDKYCPNLAGKKLDDLISGKDLTFKQKQKIINLSVKLLDKSINKEKFLQKTSRFSHLADTREIQSQLSSIGNL